MGTTQTAFLLEFRDAFRKALGEDISWTGGQATANTGCLLTHQAGRRGQKHKAERFELGDMTTVLHGRKIIIEFESKQVPISNLLKYWPYLRGELSAKPQMPVLICHFSDWWSYGIYRDLWQWTLHRMQEDAMCLYPIAGSQFDHGGSNEVLRKHSVTEAVHWLMGQLPARTHHGDNP